MTRLEKVVCQAGNVIAWPCSTNAGTKVIFATVHTQQTWLVIRFRLFTLAASAFAPLAHLWFLRNRRLARQIEAKSKSEMLRLSSYEED